MSNYSEFASVKIGSTAFSRLKLLSMQKSGILDASPAIPYMLSTKPIKNYCLNPNLQQSHAAFSATVYISVCKFALPCMGNTLASTTRRFEVPYTLRLASTKRPASCGAITQVPMGLERVMEPRYPRGPVGRVNPMSGS